MRRFPFYAYPQASFHRPHPSSPAPPSAPTPRSVINIPVFDSAPSRPSSSPPKLHPVTSPRASPAVNPSSAATIIQSHFRGFCVRRHRPLLLLRSIAKARKQLEELQSELESPGFPLKVRACEKERLRFSESVMVIILRLDAIEGSMAEVRSQRREATKMAIKLQDAIDAIVQKNEISARGMAPDDDSIQAEDSLRPDVNMVQGEACALSEEGSMDVDTMQEESTSPEDDVAVEFVPNLDKEKADVVDMVAENVSPLQPLKVEDVGQQREFGELLRSELGSLELVPQVKPVKATYDPEQNISHVTGDSNAAQAAEEDGIDALHLEAHKNHMQNYALVAKVDQETFVDDMIVASNGSAEKKSFDGSYTCMDVVQEVKGGLSQDEELCPGSPRVEEKCDYPSDNAAHQDQLQGPSTAPERMTQSNCSSDSKDSPTLPRHGYEDLGDVAHENRSDVANFCDEVKAQSSTLSMAGTPFIDDTPSIDDSTVLHQLSEDCRQLQSLVGKLLVQNKAQSNILCALGERLEMLEHQQQLNCQRNQQKTREKRKLKKGSKRSGRCHNCE